MTDPLKRLDEIDPGDHCKLCAKPKPIVRTFSDFCSRACSERWDKGERPVLMEL